MTLSENEKFTELDQVVPGVQFDGYKIFKEIKHGVISKIFTAQQIDASRIIALKILQPSLSKNPAFVEQFDAQTLITKELKHENIVEIIDQGKIDDLRYIAMEYIRGRDLKSILSAAKLLSSKLAAQIILKAAEALEFANQKSLQYHNLKLNNIMITDEGKKIKIMDFTPAYNLADFQDNQNALDSLVFFAPEQITDQPLDLRTDIYSLGMCFNNLVTGKKPFEAKSIDDLTQNLEIVPKNPAEINSNIPEQAAKIILKMIEKKPENRFSSYEELISALDDFLNQQPVTEQMKKDVAEENTQPKNVEEKIDDEKPVSNESEVTVEIIADTKLPEISLEPKIEQISPENQTESVEKVNEINADNIELPKMTEEVNIKIDKPAIPNEPIVKVDEEYKIELPVMADVQENVEEQEITMKSENNELENNESINNENIIEETETTDKLPEEFKQDEIVVDEEVEISEIIEEIDDEVELIDDSTEIPALLEEELEIPELTEETVETLIKTEGPEITLEIPEAIEESSEIPALVEEDLEVPELTEEIAETPEIPEAIEESSEIPELVEEDLEVPELTEEIAETPEIPEAIEDETENQVKSTKPKGKKLTRPVNRKKPSTARMRKKAPNNGIPAPPPPQLPQQKAPSVQESQKYPQAKRPISEAYPIPIDQTPIPETVQPQPIPLELQPILIQPIHQEPLPIEPVQQTPLPIDPVQQTQAPIDPQQNDEEISKIDKPKKIKQSIAPVLPDTKQINAKIVRGTDSIPQQSKDEKVIQEIVKNQEAEVEQSEQTQAKPVKPMIKATPTPKIQKEKIADVQPVPAPAPVPTPVPIPESEVQQKEIVDEQIVPAPAPTPLPVPAPAPTPVKVAPKQVTVPPVTEIREISEDEIVEIEEIPQPAKIKPAPKSISKKSTAIRKSTKIQKISAPQRQKPGTRRIQAKKLPEAQEHSAQLRPVRPGNIEAGKPRRKSEPMQKNRALRPHPDQKTKARRQAPKRHSEAMEVEEHPQMHNPKGRKTAPVRKSAPIRKTGSMMKPPIKKRNYDEHQGEPPKVLRKTAPLLKPSPKKRSDVEQAPTQKRKTSIRKPSGEKIPPKGKVPPKPRRMREEEEYYDDEG